MPGVISAPVSVGVFPLSLCTKFTASRKYETRFQEYHDGTTERALLVDASRRTWTMSKRLTPSLLATLRSWFEAHQADAFYFYDLRETIPPNTYDPTGTATDGRYTVRFNSDWRESIDIARTDVETVELIEISGGGTSGGGGGGGGGGGTPTPVFAQIFFTTTHVPGPSYAGSASVNLGSGFIIFDSSAYTTRTDSTSWSASSGVWSAGVGPLVAATDPRTASVNFFNYGSILGSSTPGSQLLIFDCWMVVGYSDGTSATLRPTTHTITSGSGTVTNPADAYDSDPTTYSTVEKTSFHPFDTSSPILTLSSFA